jgi:hypothetical protein
VHSSIEHGDGKSTRNMRSMACMPDSMNDNSENNIVIGTSSV